MYICSVWYTTSLSLKSCSVCISYNIPGKRVVSGLRYGPCQLVSNICDLDIHVFKCLYLLMCKVYASETLHAHWTYSGEHVVKSRRRGLNRNTGNVVNKFLH